MKIARHFLCSFLWTSVYRLGAGVHAPENAEIRRDLDCRGVVADGFHVLADRPPRGAGSRGRWGCCIRFSRCATVCVVCGSVCSRRAQNWMRIQLPGPFAFGTRHVSPEPEVNCLKNRICLRGVPQFGRPPAAVYVCHSGSQLMPL